MSFTRSTLIDFQTVLAPLVKTSNVQFYKKPSSGSRLGSAINAPFTRSGAGRKVIDASGNLVDAAANVPAWTFPIGGSSAGCPYLSFLPSVENLLTYSEQFDNAAWSKTRATVSTDATISPDGTTNADKLVEDATASNTHLIADAGSFTNGQSYFVSFFVKAAERSHFSLIAGNTATAPFNVDFDLSKGVVETATLGTGVIESVGNDWYLCGVEFTALADGTTNVNLFLSDGTSTTYNGDGTSGLFIWGAQLKEGSYISPLDYVKTEASAVTRSVDDLNDVVLDTNGYISTNTDSVMLQLGGQCRSASFFSMFRFQSGGITVKWYIYQSGDSYRIFDLVAAANILTINGLNELERIILIPTTSGLSVYRNGFLVYSTSTGDYSYDRLTASEMPSASALNLKMLNFAPTALTENQAESASSWPSFDLMVSDLGYS